MHNGVKMEACQSEQARIADRKPTRPSTEIEFQRRSFFFNRYQGDKGLKWDHPAITGKFHELGQANTNLDPWYLGPPPQITSDFDTCFLNACFLNA